MPTTVDYKRIVTQELVQMFANAASDRGLALKAANSKRANSLYKLMMKFYREIRNRGIEAQRQMLPLLQHNNPNVRVSTASLALEFDPWTALPILEDVAKQERNLLGFTADMVLKQWKEGKFRFPQEIEARRVGGRQIKR